MCPTNTAHPITTPVPCGWPFPFNGKSTLAQDLGWLPPILMLPAQKVLDKPQGPGGGPGGGLEILEFIIPAKIQTENLCNILKHCLTKTLPPHFLVVYPRKTHATQRVPSDPEQALSRCLIGPSYVYLPSLISFSSSPSPPPFSSTWNPELWVRPGSLTFTASIHIHLLTFGERSIDLQHCLRPKSSKRKRGGGGGECLQESFPYISTGDAPFVVFLLELQSLAKTGQGWAWCW